MTVRITSTLACAMILAAAAVGRPAAIAAAQPETPNVGHTRHEKQA